MIIQQITVNFSDFFFKKADLSTANLIGFYIVKYKSRVKVALTKSRYFFIQNNLQKQGFVGFQAIELLNCIEFKF